MANDWNEFLAGLHPKDPAHAPDPAALWRTFEELAAASPRAQVLKLARNFGATLAPEERAVLAGIGTAGSIDVLQQALRTPPKDTDRDAVRRAHARFEAAFHVFAEAAHTMNAACGDALFDGLDLRLQEA